MASSFIRGDGVKRVESLFKPAVCFTLLENMKILCNIQVIIYPLVKATVIKVTPPPSIHFFAAGAQRWTMDTFVVKNVDKRILEC